MDVIIQGASGLMALGGVGEQPATLDGLADMNAGLHAALGIQAALLSRDARAGDGQGRYVDLAMNDCAVTLAHENLAIFATRSKDPRSRVEPVRQGTTSRGLAPFDTFKTKDKLICLIGYQDAHRK
eukprot:gene8419-7204_t